MSRCACSRIAPLPTTARTRRRLRRLKGRRRPRSCRNRIRRRRRPQSGPLVLPVPGAQSPTAPVTTPTTPSASTPGASLGPTPTAPPSATPSPPAAAPPVPQRQSSLPYSADITGSLPRRVPPPYQAQPPASIASEQAPARAPAMVIDKLPATIGGPTLRAAAIAGDAAAEFEVANRFADGHGVPQSDERGGALAGTRRQARTGAGAIPSRRLLRKRHRGEEGPRRGARPLCRGRREGQRQGDAQSRGALCRGHQRAGRLPHRRAMVPSRPPTTASPTANTISPSFTPAASAWSRITRSPTSGSRWRPARATATPAKKRDEVAAHLDAQSLAAAKLAVQKWTAEPQPDDAVNVKAPPGGWDPPEHAAKPKPRLIGGQAARARTEAQLEIQSARQRAAGTA